ncbi:tetratricopeptide repeat protein [Streptomyces sp. NPDC050508]|uniref:tetratricopeptide repeat protein n=1 Tax=Streptomyces sp. NPDC050508 TaxID=3155405 RepID=UPI003432E3D7
MSRDPRDEAFQYLFHVHGQAGVGKTSLVGQWDSAARELGAATAYLDHDVHSVVEAMEAIAVQFRRQGAPLKGFEKLLAAYHQRRHEAEMPMGATSPGGVGVAGEGDGPVPSASLSSAVVVQAGLTGLGLLPGMGPIAGAMDPQQLAQNADRMRVALSTRFRSHADVQLVMSPVQTLTPAFLEDLAEVAERRPWVVLFFDVFEQTGPVLDTWLRDILVGEAYPGLPLNVLAVLSGQGRLDTRCWGDHLDLVAEVPLTVFTEDEARQLLAGRGVTDEEVIQVILQLTGRLPVLVDTLALKRPRDSGEVADPSETAVGRFLRGVTDPDHQVAAQVCALPLQLDEDIYRATVPEAAVDRYAWLCSLPFVTHQAGRCRYHDVVRDPMVRLQRTQSPTLWQQRHTALARTHQQRRHASEDMLPAGEYWNNAAWRDHRLNETYHRLCARPGHALPKALHDVVCACDHGIAGLRRWSQMIAQAGHDSADESLTLWGDRLTAASREDTAGIVPALTQLVAASAIEPADRVLAYTLRGREHRKGKRYAEALRDYASALAMDPRFARALYGQGETRRLMGQYEQALPSFTHAIELDADNFWNVASRGQTYRAMGRHDDALTDQTRAIELAPHNAWAITSRGFTYQTMRRYDDALADYDHAIRLEPDYAWAIRNRAATCHAMDRYEDALTDYTRAIQLVPDDAWLVLQRGDIHRAMGRYEDALTDYTRAIQLDPDSAWPVTCRADAYRALERHDDALADYNRAIELDPDSKWWVIAKRGLIHQAMGRLPHALADHTRAIELFPHDAWITTSRAEIYRAMGRYEDALTDYTRAIQLEPDNAWRVIRRGTFHRVMGRYEDALTDYTRAIQLEPDNAWAIGPRGLTYRAMSRYDDALPDHHRAIELAPDSAWMTANRGDTYRAMGRYEDALTDYTRAIELEPDNAWYRLNCGIALRLLHRPEQHDHLRQAAEMYSTEASADGSQAAHARGNLIVVHCAAREWDKASEELERFLACPPTPLRIHEALVDLSDLQKAFPMDLSQLRPLHERLEHAAGQQHF